MMSLQTSISQVLFFLLLPALLSKSCFAGDQSVSFSASRDGERLVFSTVTPGQSTRNLYLLDVKTTTASSLTTTPGVDEFDPDFSPDGRSIVYAYTNAGEDSHLRVRSLQDGKVRSITVGRGITDASPSFNFDGKWIVFCRHSSHYGSGSWTDGDVYMVKSTGGTLRRVTCKKYGYGPYSPKFLNGRNEIIYSAGQAGEEGVVNVCQVAPTSHAPITLLTRNKFEPKVDYQKSSWSTAVSPDGRRVVFASNHKQRYQFVLYVMSSSGKFSRPVAEASYDSASSFIDNGRSIFFLTLEAWNGKEGTENDHRYELWRVNIDGKNLRRVLRSEFFDDPVK